VESGAPPRQVRGYEFLEQVAIGGRGEIYLARREGSGGELVALKFLREEDLKHRDRVQAFVDEAQVSSLLLHPNIVRVFHGDVADGLPYLVMEYVDGITLWEMLERLRMASRQTPMGVAAYVTAMVADALAYAHDLRGPDGAALGLIHRDVSTVNIMVTFDGAVKLLDFGIARSRMSSLRTAPGVVKGKLDYLSPEQCNGQPLDARTDLYSLGVVLFELLTGRRPFASQDVGTAFDKIARGDRPRVHRLRPDVSPRIERIIDRAMAVKLKGRYRSAAEMLRDLRSSMQRLPELPTSSSLAGLLAELAPEEVSRVQASYGPPETTAVSSIDAEEFRPDPPRPPASRAAEEATPLAAPPHADPARLPAEEDSTLERPGPERTTTERPAPETAGAAIDPDRTTSERPAPQGLRAVGVWIVLGLVAMGVLGFGLGVLITVSRRGSAELGTRHERAGLLELLGRLRGADQTVRSGPATPPDARAGAGADASPEEGTGEAMVWDPVADARAPDVDPRDTSRNAPGQEDGPGLEPDAGSEGDSPDAGSRAAATGADASAGFAEAGPGPERRLDAEADHSPRARSRAGTRSRGPRSRRPARQDAGAAPADGGAALAPPKD